jgi:Fe-S oxidoreductase
VAAGETLAAARALLEALGLSDPIVAPEQAVALAYTLGQHGQARESAQALADELAASGARRLLVLAPDDAHTLLNIFPRLGLALPSGSEVVELTALLADLLDQGQLALRRGDAEFAYHDPCQTPRFSGRWRAPRRLLAALTARPVQEGFWREERAASCGASGGLPQTQPKLAGDMARAALADATRGSARRVVTESPACLAHLRAHAAPGVEVIGLYELLANQILSS